jgi:hypothetical protein
VKSKLTALQAFNAMTKFLDIYYEQTVSDDVGSLLGDMSFLRDGETADPAAWLDWMQALEANQLVSAQEAFSAMRKFLSGYHERTSFGSEDIERLLQSTFIEADGNIKNKTLWHTWMACVEEALKEPKGTVTFLELHR